MKNLLFAKHILTNRTLPIFVFLILLSAMIILSPLNVSAEEFKGENEMLRKLSQKELVTYFGLRYSMNRHQMKQFLSLETRVERRAWVKRFWIELDPTPASPDNERKIEHEARVELARKLYSMKKPPGWDKRGEMLIRYGLPAERRSIPADIGFYRMVPPGELWYYHSLDMLVAFQNFSLHGEFIFAFETYGLTGREQLDKLKALGEFMEFMPAELNQVITDQELAGIMNFNPDRIDYIADPNIRGEIPRDMIAAIQAEKQQKSKNNFYKYMKENPVIYSVELRDNQLPLFFDVTNFSGGENVIRTEVNFEIPSSALKFTRKDNLLTADIRLDVLVRDMDMNEVARVSDMVNASQTGGDVWQGPSHIPGQLVVALKPGYYRLGLEATDTTSGKKGVFRTNIDLKPLDRGLALSDILFASSIREITGLVKFQKGELQVVPHPLHAYKIPYPLTFYFEIYGLDTDSEGLGLYSIDYRIIPMTKRRKGPVLEDPPPVISSQFETTGFGSTQTQRLEIATDNLWEGSFTLIVEVMDRRTRHIVEQRSNFSILE
ncbi:MAG: GWxTD domain-containing protein [Candidatus Krumholzibacteria bacterium]|nr:GWxTD domain-containing protein [Candidatus Krumholzibacteria bacterium]